MPCLFCDLILRPQAQTKPEPGDLVCPKKSVRGVSTEKTGFPQEAFFAYRGAERSTSLSTARRKSLSASGRRLAVKMHMLQRLVVFHAPTDFKGGGRWEDEATTFVVRGRRFDFPSVL